MYLVIEGIDTAGKSTQLDLLQKKHSNAIFTKEPGGTKIGLKLRSMALNGEAKSPIAEMFLFLADRAEHIEEVINTNKSLFAGENTFSVEMNNLPTGLYLMSLKSGSDIVTYKIQKN